MGLEEVIYAPSPVVGDDEAPARTATPVPSPVKYSAAAASKSLHVLDVLLAALTEQETTASVGVVELENVGLSDRGQRSRGCPGAAGSPRL